MVKPDLKRKKGTLHSPLLTSQRINYDKSDQMTKYKEKVLMTPTMSFQVKKGEPVWRPDINQASCSARKNSCFQCIKVCKSDPEKTLSLERSSAFRLSCWLPGSPTATLDKNQNWTGEKRNGRMWLIRTSVYMNLPSQQFVQHETAKSKTIK